MPPLSAWEAKHKTVKKLKAKKRGQENQWLSVCQTSCPWASVCSFPGLGSALSSRSLSGETAADSGATSTARGSMGQGADAGHCCSESTLQDDVVAVIAVCYKRNTGHGCVSQDQCYKENCSGCESAGMGAGNQT